jgi:peptide/nickel transport system substrate-binding protein
MLKSVHMGRMATLMAVACLLFLPGAPSKAQTSSGRVTYGWHVTIAPAWFDPSTAPPQITPFGMLYTLHEALVRPYVGHQMGPALAESWTESPDGLVYEFRLRPGLTFHNGDPITAEDAAFSFERYRGSGASILRQRVNRVEVVDPRTIRYHLKEPWPDFMTYMGTTASAAGLVVPKQYLTTVGEEGFRKHPVGAGPYRFSSTRPGVEVVLEAFPAYWRRVPAVKTVVMRSVPEATTRALAVRTGEIDIGGFLDGADADALRKAPGMRVVPTQHASIWWVELPKQWDPKSPWHDVRVRQAANMAVNRKGINEAACLGFCPPTSIIVPRVMEFALQTDGAPYDPAGARRLLAEAGYPNGFDAGEYVAIPGFPTVAEAVLNDFNAVGIRLRMRPMERATFYAQWSEKKLPGVFLAAAGNSGNAASRVETFIWSKGGYAHGGYPDLDEKFMAQAQERDPARRKAILADIQQATIDRAMFVSVLDLRGLMGIGPRIVKHTIGDVWMNPFPSYEDMEIKP